MKRFSVVLLLPILFCACQPKEEQPVPTKEPSASPVAPVATAQTSADQVAPIQTASAPQSVSEQDIQEHLPFLSKQDYAFVQTPFGRQSLQQVILREKLIQADALARRLDQTDDYQTLVEQKRAQLEAIYNDYSKHMLEELWYQQRRDNGDLHVSDEEIDTYYKKYPYEMTVQQIILDNAQTADQVLRTLKRSPSSWKTMARQYSIAPESLRNEQFTFMPGEFLPEIEVIAANSVPGSVQGFFKTALGFHIIMKTKERRLPYKEAAPRIRAVLENKKLDKILEKLHQKYEVTIDEKTE